MPRHGCRANYFADDKDISDILEQGKFTPEKLREYARKRGIFLSDKLEKSEMVKYLRSILCDWNQVKTLVSALDTTERSPQLLPARKPGTFTDSDILASIEKLKAEHQKLGLQSAESISIRKTSDEQYAIDVSYSETHWNKTRLLQNEPKTATIFIARNESGLRLQIEDSEKGKQIANMLSFASQQNPEPETRSIDLSEVRTPKQRTALFLELINGVYGHELHDVTNVNVEFMKSTEETSDPAESEEETEKRLKEKKAQIRSTLKSAALSGTGLLRERRYQEMVNSEYYLCKVFWMIDHISKTGDRISLSAEFSEPENGKGFRFSVLGKWSRNSEGELKKTRQRLEAGELKHMQDLVEQAAFEAYEYVTSEDFSLDGAPNKPDDETAT